MDKQLGKTFLAAAATIGALVWVQTASAQLFIPFGEGGGGLQLGPNGIGIQTPGRLDGNEQYVPGESINIPFPQQQPNRPPQFPQNNPLYPQNNPQYPQFPQNNPQYVPQQPYYPAQPQAQPQAPKNNVVLTQKKVQKNGLALNQFGIRASAETDARQAIQAELAKSRLDGTIRLHTLGTGDPALKDEWDEIARNGAKTEDVAAFIAKHGPAGTNKLTANMKTTLEMRQKFAKYSDGLQSGLLTADMKDQMLADLQKTIDGEAAKPGINPAYIKKLTENVTNMQNFNTMGEIADATQNSGNPFPTLLLGADQIGMPPMFISEMTGFPIMPIAPVPNGAMKPAAAANIVIQNPASTGQSVRYLLDTHDFTMAAGSSQKLDRSYTISFDPGADGQAKRYALSTGVYEWQLDKQQGWNLYKRKVEVVIDNSRYDGEFRYLLNNEYQTAAAGQVTQHSGERPLEVAFDPGNGGSEVRKVLTSGRYVVGVEPKEGRLDLFERENVDRFEAEQAPYASTTRLAGNNANRQQRVEALLAQLRPAEAAGGSGVSGGISPLGGGALKRTQSVGDLLNSLKPIGDKNGAGS